MDKVASISEWPFPYQGKELVVSKLWAAFEGFEAP